MRRGKNCCVLRGSCEEVSLQVSMSGSVCQASDGDAVNSSGPGAEEAQARGGGGATGSSTV